MFFTYFLIIKHRENLKPIIGKTGKKAENRKLILSGHPALKNSYLSLFHVSTEDVVQTLRKHF